MKKNTLAALSAGLFAAVLILCLIFGWPLLAALVFGYLVFFAAALALKKTPGETLKMSLRGVKAVKNILFVFLLIGMMTASWRASGAIACIVYYASRLLVPEIFLLITFLLCCALSMLTGTAFGTAATIGVICMAIGRGAGAPPALMGGAILAGSYFGDRCSPMSTSALLVCQLTGTNIYKNIRAMLKTGLWPFVLACLALLAAGFFTDGGRVPEETLALLEGGFRLHWITVLPAALIVALSALRVNVKITMAASILSAAAVCLLVQRTGAWPLLKTLVMGYTAPDANLDALLGGGGIISMVRVAAIVCLSSSYSGIFAGTGLLDGASDAFCALSRRTSPFAAMLAASAASSAVACNQTLAIMLTEQLCRRAEPEGGARAIGLENSAVIAAPLIPWSIASGVPLAAVGAPELSILAAFFLYLLPLWSLAGSLIKKRRAACKAESPVL